MQALVMTYCIFEENINELDLKKLYTKTMEENYDEDYYYEDNYVMLADHLHLTNEERQDFLQFCKAYKKNSRR